MTAEFQVEFTVDEAHIDLQGIMDGLYYRHYLEKCRHQYGAEVLGLDLKAWAQAGVNIVLSQYTLRFRRPLRKGDRFVVTCSAHPDAQNRPRFHLKQRVLKDQKIMADAVFTATFVSSNGGRPFLPDDLIGKLVGEAFNLPPMEF